MRQLVRQLGDADTEDVCDYCGGTVGPFVSPDALGDVFRRIVDDNYVPVDQLSNAPHIDTFDEGDELGMIMDEDFQVFSDAVLDERSRLLTDILDTATH